MRSQFRSDEWWQPTMSIYNKRDFRLLEKINFEWIHDFGAHCRTIIFHFVWVPPVLPLEKPKSEREPNNERSINLRRLRKWETLNGITHWINDKKFKSFFKIENKLLTDRKWKMKRNGSTAEEKGWKKIKENEAKEKTTNNNNFLVASRCRKN